MKPTGLLVCMPVRNAVSIETALCLSERLDGYPNELLHVDRRLPLIQARNFLAKFAREINPESLAFDPQYVLWVDDDVLWFDGQVARAIAILEENQDVDMVTGLASGRCAYDSSNAIKERDYTRAIAPLKLRPDELAPVGACGFHFVLMRRELLNRVGNDPFNNMKVDLTPLGIMSPLVGIGEDFSFCIRARQRGAKIVTERSLVVGHVEVSEGLVYFPYRPPMFANGLEPPQNVPTTLKPRTERNYLHRHYGPGLVR